MGSSSSGGTGGGNGSPPVGTEVKMEEYAAAISPYHNDSGVEMAHGGNGSDFLLTPSGSVYSPEWVENSEVGI